MARLFDLKLKLSLAELSFRAVCFAKTSYKKECQQIFLSVGSVPTLFFVSAFSPTV